MKAEDLLGALATLAAVDLPEQAAVLVAVPQPGRRAVVAGIAALQAGTIGVEVVDLGDEDGVAWVGCWLGRLDRLEGNTQCARSRLETGLSGLDRIREVRDIMRPFEGDSDYATLFKIGNEEPPAPSVLRPGLPEALCRAGNFAFIEWLWRLWSPAYHDRDHVAQVKRMLADSAIAHSGFILTGFVGASQAGELGGISSVQAVLFFRPEGKIPFASVAWVGMTGVVTARPALKAPEPASIRKAPGTRTGCE